MKGMETKFNKLKEIDKGNPFTVPENYFAQFNEEIMNRLPEKEYVPPRQVSLWDKVKPWVYMAAMFVGLYVTINFLTKQNETVGTSENVAIETNYWSTVHITEEEFYKYLEDQLIEDGYFDYMYDKYYFN